MPRRFQRQAADRLNILYVIHHPIFGGPHNEALRLHAALGRLGQRTAAVMPEDGDAAAARLREGGVEVDLIPLHRMRGRPDPRLQLRFMREWLPDVGRLREVIRRRAIDVVVIPGIFNHQGAIAARREGAAVVYELLDSSTQPALRGLEMLVVRRLADALLATGEALVPLHLGASRPTGLPIIASYPSVDAERFQPSPAYRAEVRAELGIPHDALVLGMVANVSPMKGIEYYVRAAARVAHELPEARFVLVGPEYEHQRRYTDRVRAEIASTLPDPSRFLFAGGQTDVERWYPAFDVTLVTSLPRSEGIPATSIESMACGVPVVATNVGALAEAVRDGVSGFVVPPLQPDAIAGAALRLLLDDDLRERMGRSARAEAVERFSADVIAATHSGVFAVAAAHAAQRRARRTRSDER